MEREHFLSLQELLRNGDWKHRQWNVGCPAAMEVWRFWMKIVSQLSLHATHHPLRRATFTITNAIQQVVGALWTSCNKIESTRMTTGTEVLETTEVVRGRWPRCERMCIPALAVPKQVCTLLWFPEALSWAGRLWVFGKLISLFSFSLWLNCWVHFEDFCEWFRGMLGLGFSMI
jgi:hypothetical protein